MSDDEHIAPRRLLSVTDAADYLGTSRSALLADEKRIPEHPQSFRHPQRRRVVFDREELDAYIVRVKAAYRGEPLPPSPTTARQQFLQEQIAAWCAKKVLIPVEPGSIEAKSAAVREALQMKHDVDVVTELDGEEIERIEYRWAADGRCVVTAYVAKPGRRGRLPKWTNGALG